MRRWACSTRALLWVVAVAALGLFGVRTGTRALGVWSEIQEHERERSVLLSFAEQIEAGGIAYEGTFCEPRGSGGSAFGFTETIVAPGKPPPDGLRPSGKTAGDYRAEAERHRAAIARLWLSLFW
jgi:hypothetical protein